MNTNTKLPDLGRPVVTSDGHLVGHVSAQGGDCFKIDKPMAPDAWLGVDVVAGIDEDVRLSLTRDELEGTPEGVEHMGFHVHHAT